MVKLRTKYNHIDPQLIGKTVFEIGVNEENLLDSKIRDKILTTEYLGLDIVDRKNKILPTIKGDIINYHFQKKYDTILMIEVLEHLHFRDWEMVLNKLKKSLKVGGYLILSTPNNEKLNEYLNRIPKDRYQIHTIFGITPNIFRRLLPDCKVKIIRWLRWRDEGESHVWAFGRFIKRLIIKRNHSPFVSNLIVTWKRIE